MATIPTPIQGLLHTLDEAYNRKAWHGTNLRGAIRGPHRCLECAGAR